MTPAQKRTRTLKEKYGEDFFQKIGKKGAETTHTKYDIIPIPPCYFQYADKETGELVGKPWS